MKVLVTGASGYIGIAVANSLVDLGYEVHGASRTRGPEQGSRITWHSRISLGVNTGWEEILEGVDTIIHTAGVAHVGKRERKSRAKEIHRVNGEGTVLLAKQAASLGVRRFIFISSIAVYGLAKSSQPITEETVCAAADPYETSKLVAEHGLIELCSTTHLEIVILRPPLVYGPRAPGNFTRLVEWVRSGLPLPFRQVRNVRSMISIWNLADVIAACIENVSARNQVYLVSDLADVSTPELITYIARGLNIRPKLVPVPPVVLKSTGALIGRGRDVDSLCESLQLDCEKLSRDLQWVPRFEPSGAIPAAARGYFDTA